MEIHIQHSRIIPDVGNYIDIEIENTFKFFRKVIFPTSRVLLRYPIDL